MTRHKFKSTQAELIKGKGDSSIEEVEAHLESSGEPAPSEAKEAGETPPSLEQELAAKTKLADEYLDQLKRLKADFENYKKRQERERSELFKFANSSLILDLLPVLDSFDRAMNKVHASHDLQAFEKGMELIYKQLTDTLSKIGLRPIEVIGQPFDPTKHEALMQVESQEHEEATVVQELTRGYLLHERVIRPAQVAISSGQKN